MATENTLEKIIAVLTTLMAEMESQAFQDEAFSQLSMRQMLYLNTIAALERPTFSALAATLGVTKPSVSTIVNTLIRKGFVEKVQDPDDLRVFHIVLTPAGQQFGQLHDAVHQRMVKLLTANLTGQEISTLTEILQKAI